MNDDGSKYTGAYIAPDPDTQLASRVSRGLLGTGRGKLGRGRGSIIRAMGQSAVKAGMTLPSGYGVEIPLEQLRALQASARIEHALVQYRIDRDFLATQK